MNLEELEQATRVSTQPVVTASMTVLSAYRFGQVSSTVWLALLETLYQILMPAATTVARASRTYYDAKRTELGLPLHDVPLRTPTFERFVHDMDEVYKVMSKPETTQAEVEKAALRVARTVENAGRWTMMKATEEPDPAYEEVQRRNPNLIKGWARVATGRETCGWCLMLVSRGPVYQSARGAGAKQGDAATLSAMDNNSFDAKESMHAWHTGCDCKIVPVFDRNNWEGRDRYLAAWEMWKKETRGYYGKDAINAMRRATHAGKYDEYLADQTAAIAA